MTSRLAALMAPLLSLPAFGQANAAASAVAPLPLRADGSRPRIGLVLSGGGARGLAHVGVLKVLEREHVRIDAIADTSMGAIVGGLYASGMSADQLERELRQIDGDALFATRVARPFLSQRRKEEDFEISTGLEFGVHDGQLRAPQGAFSSRGLELLLRRFTLPVRHIEDFDHLPIPFRAVATDMGTGKPIVLSHGDLAVALRSSMSVPGVFAPTEVDGHILGDGGLVDNLPMDVVRAKLHPGRRAPGDLLGDLPPAVAQHRRLVGLVRRRLHLGRPPASFRICQRRHRDRAVPALHRPDRPRLRAAVQPPG